MTAPSPLDHVAIVLQEPRYPENIGSVARAAWNMGLTRLIVVNPEELDRPQMDRLATSVAGGLLDRMEIHASLAEALAPFQFIVGTTARLGGERKQITTPGRAAETIRSLDADTRVALLFGPEYRGLSNEELRYCQITVNIPTASVSSLNLAQAVLILSYEIFLAHRFPQEIRRRSVSPGRAETHRTEAKRSFEHPPLATSFELEGMYGHLAEILQMMDFLDKNNPDHWMMSIRRFLSRVQLYSHEVRMIRGICRQLKWFVKNRKPTEAP